MRKVQLHRVYRHFKGDCYLVEDVARHSETDEELVMYRTLYGDRSLWARPKQMFLAEVRGQLDEFARETDQFDDLTMLCIQYRGRKDE